MGKYKTEDQVKNGKKWVIIRLKIRLNFVFFMVKKVQKYKNENWVRKGKKWVNIKVKIKTNFGF